MLLLDDFLLCLLTTFSISIRLSFSRCSVFVYYFIDCLMNLLLIVPSLDIKSNLFHFVYSNFHLMFLRFSCSSENFNYRNCRTTTNKIEIYKYYYKYIEIINVFTCSCHLSYHAVIFLSFFLFLFDSKCWIYICARFFCFHTDNHL